MQYSSYTGLQDVTHSGLVKHDFSYCNVDPMQSYGTLVIYMIYGSVTEDIHYVQILCHSSLSLAVQWLLL